MRDGRRGDDVTGVRDQAADGGKQRPDAASSSLVVMLLVAALCAVVGAVRPMSPQAPVALEAALAVVATVLAGLVWWTGHPAWRAAGVLAVVGGITAVVAQAATPAGAAGLAISYAWVALYAGAFLSRALARGTAALVAGSFAAALAVNPFPGAAHVWFLTTITVAAAAEVLARLVERLRVASLHDPLTGALNRRGVEEAADRSCGGAAPRGPRPSSSWTSTASRR